MAGKKIVLAEDDRFVRKATTAALRQRGFEVVAVEDGEEALRQTRAERPDLVLLDMIMPKMQGFQVLDALKQDAETASIPVVVCSSLEQAEDQARAREAGAAAYIVKADLSLKELARRVEEVLDTCRP